MALNSRLCANLENRPLGLLLALLGALVIAWAPVAAAKTGYSGNQLPSAVTSYELPDGTRFVVCVGGRGSPDGSKAGPHCRFCNLTKCFGLELHIAQIESAYIIHTLSKRLFPSEVHYIHRFCFLKAPRAPPAIQA
jgi:hypothetical protein